MNSELFHAAIAGNISEFRTSLSNGANINEQNEDGATPLMIACKYGYTELVKFIISRDADVDICDNEGRSCLYYAELSNHREFNKIFNGLHFSKPLNKNKTSHAKSEKSW